MDQMEKRMQEHNTSKQEETIYASQQLIVFHVGKEEFGLQIDQIKEVVITPKIAHIPLMPTYIKGIANIRGNIIAIVDLIERFKIATDAQQTIANYTLVVESEQLKMGVLVENVPDTLTVYENEIDTSSSFLKEEGEQTQSYIKGIVNKKGRLIILIDIFKIVSIEELNKAIQLIN